MKVKWSGEELKCMQVLRASAFDYEQFKDRNPKRLDGTCQWVLKHENFRIWKDSRSSSLLWVSADPGCGKSVLSRSLVDDEDFRSTKSHNTCYFFFKDDNDVQKNIRTALSAVLHQLFSQKPALIQYAMSDFATDGEKLPQSFQKLWVILMKAVADPKAGRVFCILDALDECAEEDRYQIIDAISIFYQQARFSETASQLNMCVTSRPYVAIERRFTNLISNFPTIRLHGEQESDIISQEINQVIKSIVSQLGSELKLSKVEQSKIEMELLGKTHRTYLWLSLTFDMIRKMNRLTSRKLQKALNTLPSTVDEAFEAILARIENEDQPQARKLLHIIVAATRPLSLNEMNIALAIEDYHCSYNDLQPDLEDESRFEVSVRNLCGLFVNVVDQRVHLIHQTAKEFLVAKSEVAAGGWKHSLIPIESELLMSRICVTFLSFKEFDRSTDETFLAREYRFLDYAAGSWASHYQKAQSRATEQMSQCVLKICDTRLRRFHIWSYAFWRRFYQTSHFEKSLIVASHLGHEAVVRQLLATGNTNANLKDEYGRTALLQAAENGHEVLSLFEFAINPNSFGQSVENLSYINSLIHVGIVHLGLGDDGVPTIGLDKPRNVNEKHERGAYSDLPFYFMGYANWQELIEALDIKSSMIPHRAEEVIWLSAQNWYD